MNSGTIWFKNIQLFLFRRYTAEILPIRRKTLFNQSIILIELNDNWEKLYIFSWWFWNIIKLAKSTVSERQIKGH